ncbi:serine carboxypeptidase-like 13 [Olea europaea subsp. europaea]|uniref:Serine carboxypeptidase-like 13 n=1 Tax=Olea europaea subsp. europaea TaxID=158383 RepID=A0A8S0TI45_OLEEU|nr:serine carboxypeptidase-like 13 [Olea europaea subsp. europaea]
MSSFLLIFNLLLLILPQYAYSHSIVEFLPGFEGHLPFKLETGYIGVGESEDVQLFYYFVESETNPENDPLIIWLTGGPGCSSLSGLSYEIGPFSFDTINYNGGLPSLVLNSNSWTKAANIIFLDSPVLTGFSYARTPTVEECTDIEACGYAHEFLQKWLIEHPQFISNQFYVGGDSYSGLIVPVLTQIIADGIGAGIKPIINLKGYILGNPVTSHSDLNYKIPYSHGMGFISSELYKSLKKHCKGEYFRIDPNNALCNQGVQAFNECVDGINDKHILEPKCDFDYINQQQLFGKRRSLDDIFRKPNKGFSCRAEEFLLVSNWANNPDVQEALHVRKGTIEEWVRCNRHLTTFTITVVNSVPYHKNLSIKGYRSLIYSGDHDLVVPFLATRAWIKSLNYSIVDEWRPWIVNDQVAGYTKSYSNQMTFATVKGGGHTAPTYRREECFAMFKRWISYEPI